VSSYSLIYLEITQGAIEIATAREAAAMLGQVRFIEKQVASDARMCVCVCVRVDRWGETCRVWVCVRV
jgi:hypothetical protein